MTNASVSTAVAPDVLLPARPVEPDRLLDRRQRGRELRRRALLQVRLHDELRQRPRGRARRRRDRRCSAARSSTPRATTCSARSSARRARSASRRRSRLRVVPVPETVKTLRRVLRHDARGGRDGRRDRRRRRRPGRDRDDGQAHDRGLRADGRHAGYPIGRGAALIVELDGAAGRVRGALRRGRARSASSSGSDDVRIARDEAERQLIWKTRKAAFAAMGRISAELLRPGRRHPAHEAARGPRPHRRARGRVRHARRQRLPRRRRQPPPARLLRRRGRGRGRARRGAVGQDPRGLRRRRRLDHRRARRRRRQAQLHAEDVRRARPRGLPDAALRVRPRGPREPRQGHADAAAVRRGARPVPAPPARASPASPSASDGRGPGRHRAPRHARGGGGAAARARRGRARRADPRRRHQARVGRRRRADRDVELVTDGLDAVVEHNDGDFTAVLAGRACRSRAPRSVRDDGPDVRARPTPRPGRGGDRSAACSRRPTPARCATATARRATSSSGSPSRCPTDRWRRPAGRSSRTSRATTSPSSSRARSARSGSRSRVAVRLHPRPDDTATASGRSADPAALASAAATLARLPLEADCLDVAWHEGDGRRARPLRRRGGRAPGRRGRRPPGRRGPRGGPDDRRRRRPVDRAARRPALRRRRGAEASPGAPRTSRASSRPPATPTPGSSGAPRSACRGSR